MKNELATEGRVEIPPEVPKQKTIHEEYPWEARRAKQIGSAISKLDPVDQIILWQALCQLSDRMSGTRAFIAFCNQNAALDLHKTQPESKRIWDEAHSRYLTEEEKGS